MKRKRSKRSRLRGKRSCGYGFRKKHRGKGSKAGKGMAGTGKRAGQRRVFVVKYMPNYLGKSGFKSKKKKLEIINLVDIERNLEEFSKKGIAKKTSEGIEINLKNFKVLGKGEIKNKLIVHAKKISKKAKDKIEKGGGKFVEG